MLMSEGIALGNCIYSVGIKVDPIKIQVILNIPSLKTQKEVIIFLGHAGHYRRFVENFTKLECPLFSLLSKDAEFTLTNEFQFSFEAIKKRFPEAPIL